MKNGKEPGSTLSGLQGIEQRVSASVRFARQCGEIELAAEGARLLAESDALHLLAAGDDARAEGVKALMAFESKALKILAKYV